MGEHGDAAEAAWHALVQAPAPLGVFGLAGETVLLNDALAVALTASAIDELGHFCAAQGADAGDVELMVELATGELRACQVRAVRDGGELRWFAARLLVPSELTVDALTGLATRQTLLLNLEKALARRRRHGNDVVLVVADLDDFKSVNDTHGHVVGDAVLADVGLRLLAIGRPEDTMCRWGGDEFVWLLEDTAGRGGDSACARMAAVLEEPVDIGGLCLRPRASCGWVDADGKQDAIALLAAADLHMYEQKRSRRGAADGDRLRRISARLREAASTGAELRVAAQQARAVARQARTTAARPSRHDDA
jgi:diguanylate cyclase (GGDEF)-like protein